MGKNLRNFFNTSWLSLLLLLLFIDTSKIVVHQADSDTYVDFSQWQTYAHITICIAPPLTIFMILMGYVRYFQGIERQLYPQIQNEYGTYIKPEEINFKNSYEGTDPFLLYETVPQPRYLVIENYDDNLNAFESHQLKKKPIARSGLSLTKGGDQDEEASSIMDDT
jgi:hypothetical protein